MDANPTRSFGVPARRRTQADRREESQRRMMRAASFLIAQNGVRGTSLAEIGVHAGYSRGLPAERYQNKLGMVQALLEDMDAWMTRAFDEHTAGQTGEAAVAAVIAAHFDTARQAPHGTAAFHAILHEARFGLPELRIPIADIAGRWRGRLSRHLVEAQSQSQFRRDIGPEIQAQTITALISDAILEDSSDGDPSAKLQGLVQRLFSTTGTP